jgi:tetratricopeptide (TPR) repeat protein
MPQRVNGRFADPATQGVLRPARFRAMLRSVIAPLLVLAAALAAEPAAPVVPEQPPPAAAQDDLAATLARADAAWAERDAPGQLEASHAALEAASRLAGEDAAVLWRLARHEAWLSEDPAIPNKLKSELGKKAWLLGERAIAADPTLVEGWFYAVSGMGNYSLGIGILSALAQGIEGKFKDRLSRAERLSPGFQGGAIQVAWGRFWFKLPWPKHDARKCQKALRAALAQNPDNVRAHVYLAELQLDEDRPAEAKAEYQAALLKPPGQYDAPEERRWQGVARAALERLERK